MTRDPTVLTPSMAGTSPRPLLTSTELLAHPAFKTNEWHLPPTKSGYAPINASSQRPGGPFNIYYELHGSGPIKLVWIMGLGAYYTAWKRQTKYFAHDAERQGQYSSLVFDNRGVGRSGKPTCRYSTSEMAMDVLELLVHVGWMTAKETQGYVEGEEARRDLHVAGVSMGGMIAQEVGILIPQRIATLFLISTAPRLVRTVPFMENLRQRINMFVPRNVDVQLDEVAHRLFSDEFLASEDLDETEPDRKFACVQDRFAAAELAKRMDKEGFTRKGFVLQAIAAGWHHKSKEQLQFLAERIGKKRICVIHGTVDQMITFKHFEIFKEELGEGVEYKVWEGCGHVLMWEREKEFNAFVEGFVQQHERR